MATPWGVSWEVGHHDHSQRHLTLEGLVNGHGPWEGEK